MPSINVRRAFDVWLDGNEGDCVPPLKDITASRRPVFSKIATSMKLIHSHVPEENKLYGALFNDCI